jgi:hypothetical protein
MQDNAFLRNGSSIFEGNTITHVPEIVRKGSAWSIGGYQTSYVFHIENPIHFSKEIKVTIEHGHGNHLANENSSVAYWYAKEPTRVIEPPSVEKRQPIFRDNKGIWLMDNAKKCPGRRIPLNVEMKRMKKEWQKRFGKK